MKDNNNPLLGEKFPSAQNEDPYIFPFDSGLEGAFSYYVGHIVGYICIIHGPVGMSLFI